MDREVEALALIRVGGQRNGLMTEEATAMEAIGAANLR
jgi:hypothetical protein